MASVPRQPRLQAASPAPQRGSGFFTPPSPLPVSQPSDMPPVSPQSALSVSVSISHNASISSSTSSSLSPSAADCGPSLATVPAGGSSHSGYLLKVGGKVQSWKRRFFFIREHHLCYAKKEKGAVIASIALPSSVLHLYQPVNSHSNRPHLWGVAPAASSRLFVFQCESDGERDEWIQSCLECQARLFSPPHSASASVVMQGWLQGTRKGFFVLSPSSLSYYKSTAPVSSNSPPPGPADKVWNISAGCALSATAGSGFSFSFQAEGEKRIDIVCTDGVERNHWYRAVHELVERKRREQQQRQQPALQADVAADRQDGLEVRVAELEWQAGEDRCQDGTGHGNVVLMDDDDGSSDGSDGGQQLMPSGVQFKYADSDDEDFPAEAVTIAKDEDEEKQQSRERAAPPSAAVVPTSQQLRPPAHPPPPRPPSSPPPPASSQSSDDDADDDGDDGAYDPLFSSLAEQQTSDPNEARSSLISNPLCRQQADRRRSLRHPRPVLTSRNRQTASALLLSAAVAEPQSASLENSPLVDPRCPLSPPPILARSGSSGGLMAAGAAAAASSVPGLLSSSLSVLTASLQSLLTVAFKGDWSAFRASVMNFLDQRPQPAAAPAVTGPPAAATASLSSSAPPPAAATPAAAHRSAAPALSTVCDAVEFQSNPLAAAQPRTAASAVAARSNPSGVSAASSSIPSSPLLGRAAPHPRLLHVHVLEAIDLPCPASSSFSPPDSRVELSTRGYARKDDEEDESRVKLKKSAKVKTRVCSASRSPLWDEYLSLQLDCWADELVLDVVQPGSITADLPLGRMVVSLDELQQAADGRLSGWFPLCSRASAQPTQGLLYLSLALDAAFATETERGTERFHDHRRSRLQLPPLTPHQYPIRLFLCTWNVGNACPPADLSALLPLHLADVYVVSTQECHYAPRHDLKSCRMDWLCTLLRHFGCGFTLVKYCCLWDIRLAVFVTNRLAKAVSNVQAQTVATGIGNMLGNKGGVCVSLLLHHAHLCFLNLHLAAHQENTQLRNSNVKTIVRSLRLSTGCGGGGGGQGAGDVMSGFHHVFLMGDLNYRLEYGEQGDSKQPSQQQFRQMSGMMAEAQAGNASLLTDLLVTDQLRHEMQDGRVLPVALGWKEGEPTFPPTFKVWRQAGTRYVSSRSPAWCDRILWKELSGYAVHQLLLDSAQAVDSSDHKPVVSLLQVDSFLLPAPIDHRKGGCSLAVLTLTVDELPPLRYADIFLTIDSALFSSQLTTPTHRKPTPPQWRDLPARPLQYNNLHRIAHSLLSVRVWSGGSGDVIARGLVSLRELGQYSQRGEQTAAAAGLVKGGSEGSVCLPFGARLELSHGGGGASLAGERRSQWLDLEFSVCLSLLGLEAGRLSGQLRFVWKDNADADDRAA